MLPVINNDLQKLKFESCNKAAVSQLYKDEWTNSSLKLKSFLASKKIIFSSLGAVLFSLSVCLCINVAILPPTPWMSNQTPLFRIPQTKSSINVMNNNKNNDF